MPDTKSEVLDAEPVASQSQEVAVRAAPRSSLVVRSRTGMAIIPQTMDEVWRLAGVIAAANMAPKSYGRDQNAITVGICHGMEVGFTPMAALQSIAVINGMPSIWGDGALALIEDSGLLEDKKEWVDTDEQGGLVAHCEMKRKGRSWTIQQFSWHDAKIAKLDKKDTYQLYGRRMLQRRARAWAMTDGFSDVLRGLHIREAITIQDVEDEDKGPSETAEARPTREPAKTTDKKVAESVRKAELAMNKEFKAVVGEPAKATPEASSDSKSSAKPSPEPESEPEHIDHDPETGEVNETEPENTEKPTEEVSAMNTAKHAAVDSLLRKKIAAYTTATMISGVLEDYKDELDAMKSDDRPRWNALKAFKDERLAALKKK